MVKWTIRIALTLGLVSAVVAATAWSQILTTTNHPPTEAFVLSAEQVNPVNGKGGSDISGPYMQLPNWPQPLPGGRLLASAPGFYVESPDRIYAISRGSRDPYHIPQQPGLGWHSETVDAFFKMPSSATNPRHDFIFTIYDHQGKMVDYWKQFDDQIRSVQRLHVNVNDPEHTMYIDGDARLLKVSRDGKVLQTITAKDVPTKTDERTFWPEGIAFAPDGGFWTISNARVIKFSKDGKYVSQFGTEGTGPDQMNGAHDIVYDGVGHRFYLADRDNHRIQVYDEGGKRLDTWPNIISPSAIRMTKDRRYLWVADLYGCKFLKFDLNGKLITSFGTWGYEPGAISGVHDFTTDSDGTLYVGNHNIQALQKFVPRKDGNPEQLIGELLPR